MSTITTTSQPATSSLLKRLISGHPLLAYFVIAFAGTWAFFLPFALSRNVNGLGILPVTIPDTALFIAFILASLAGPPLASIAVTAVPLAEQAWDNCCTGVCSGAPASGGT